MGIKIRFGATPAILASLHLAMTAAPAFANFGSPTGNIQNQSTQSASQVGSGSSSLPEAQEDQAAPIDQTDDAMDVSDLLSDLQYEESESC